MGEAKPFKPVKLIMGILSTRPDLHESLFKELSSAYGPIERVTDPVPFAYTDYYDREMGRRPDRFFVVFRDLVDPSVLAACKLWTNRLEGACSVDGQRVVNIDPGLLSAQNLTLATTKNRSHRIPLDGGIYGEVTLLYADHRFQDFPWTYADYKSDRSKELFLELRKAYLRQVADTLVV